jgi:SAM-dependent methyltransferase
MEETHRESAELIHSRLSSTGVPPALFRSALLRVPPLERDAWVDRVFGLDALPDDGPELPPGCVPYLPCPVDALLRMVESADIQASDVFVDVGAGLGRAAALVHLLTGASAIGIEIQPGLVLAARELTQRLNLSRVSWVEGDATLLAGRIASGSVFFLYCPFSGERLAKVLADLEPIARTREILVCSVGLPLPPCPWLTPASPPSEELEIHRTIPGWSQGSRAVRSAG